jgi:hypothetical protein
MSITDDEDDALDGCCDLDFAMGRDVTDDMIPWVVLFATLLDDDLEPRDLVAVERKAEEWRVLFQDQGPVA